MGFRVGHGYDVHRLCEGRKLILGGEEIPFDKGLMGHSDADVLTHSIMDALLGASGLGDIGIHFPDTNDKYENISSLILLDRVKKLLDEKNITIQNIDVTVVAQAPKLSNYRDAIISNIATTLNIPKTSVNIKATTEEKLGFTGTGEGIASHAVCLVSD
jgi:2-C-methyl-D-erythritol 2,4-cyclodiphosphate synthase